MSGSVHWKKDGFEHNIPWIENQISSVNPNTSRPHFYIAARQLENKPLLTANKRLYRASKDKGHRITYEYFQDGRGSVRRREKLFDGLRALKHTKTTL